MPLGSGEILALTGMMGSGKTATARELSRLTARPVISTDEEVVRRTGKAVRAIFAEDGEARFRALEREVVADLPAGAIVDLGGGAFCDAAIAERLLSTGRVVFLEVSAEEAARRIGNDPGRPLAGRWEDLRRERLPHYRRAHLTVATDGLSPAEVARSILERLKALDR